MKEGEKDKKMQILSILMLDKGHFELRRITRDKEGHFTGVNEEIIIILIVYATSNTEMGLQNTQSKN